ncbi:MAG: AI-2E family transporter [Chloroflexi bacterium]|nr:MAG: AI-2E family transporter [Chloroflexota bacterium]
MRKIDWPRIRDILIVCICIGILLWAAFSIMGMFVHAIVLLLLSMAVAFLVTPLVNFLNRYIPRVLAAVLVYIVVLAGVGMLCYALIFSLIQQINYFSNNLPGYVKSLPNTYSTLQDWLLKQGVPQASISKAISTISDQAQSLALSLASNLVSIVLIVTDVIVNVLLVMVLSFYLTLDGKRVRDSLVGLATERTKPHVLLFEDALNRVVGRYIRGQLSLAAIIGVLAGFGCFFLGLNQFALIIGVLAFLFETIPMVGPALASIPAILISLLLPTPFPRTYEIAIYFVIVQMIESNILGPRIMGHAVGLHPVASILALIVGGQLFGAFGALLATPVVAAFWVVIASLYNSLRGKPADTLLMKKRSPWIRSRRRSDQSIIEEDAQSLQADSANKTPTTAKAHFTAPSLNSSPSSSSIPIHAQNLPKKTEGAQFIAPSSDILHLVPDREAHSDGDDTTTP